MKMQFRRPDGTFVAIVRGMPYHVVESDPLFATVDASEIAALPLEPEPEPEPPRLPTSCGPAQAKIVLYEMDLLDAVEAMIAAHPYRPVSIWYHSATVWERSHPYVTALAYELDLTDEQIDGLFALAVTK
jgi:hypothetical protein